MKSVIDHIMSSDYNYYSMSENNKLIDSTGRPKNERIVYRGMIRDAIKGTENLTYRVRFCFICTTAQADMFTGRDPERSYKQTRLC